MKKKLSFLVACALLLSHFNGATTAMAAMPENICSIQTLVDSLVMGETPSFELPDDLDEIRFVLDDIEDEDSLDDEDEKIVFRCYKRALEAFDIISNIEESGICNEFWETFDSYNKALNKQSDLIAKYSKCDNFLQNSYPMASEAFFIIIKSLVEEGVPEHHIWYETDTEQQFLFEDEYCQQSRDFWNLEMYRLFAIMKHKHKGNSDFSKELVLFLARLFDNNYDDSRFFAVELSSKNDFTITPMILCQGPNKETWNVLEAFEYSL